MMFGVQSRFAIQVTIDKPADQYKFGQICFWAGGRQIGDYSQRVMLAPVIDFLADTLVYQSNRSGPAFVGMPAAQILAAVYQAIYGDPSPSASPEDMRSAAQEYGRFQICPNGCEAFDGERAVLMEEHPRVEESPRERFIWRNFTDQSVEEINLVAGEYEATVRDLLQWAVRELGRDPASAAVLKKNFVIAGQFLMPRAEIEQLIRRSGGQIERKISDQTSWLVIGRDQKPNSAISRQARSAGIPVLTESELLEMLGATGWSMDGRSKNPQ
jgi:hypothetical protein